MAFALSSLIENFRMPDGLVEVENTTSLWHDKEICVGYSGALFGLTMAGFPSHKHSHCGRYEYGVQQKFGG
jgi:hypothetical protein